MPRIQVEKNDDMDPKLPGGRNTVHRWTLMLTHDELAALQRGDRVKLTEKMPDLTVKHLYMDVTVV